MKPEEKEQDERRKMLLETIEKLGEHFDCIQIFAQVNDGSARGTKEFMYGSGNANAIYGQVRCWVDMTEAGWIDPILNDDEDDDE